LRYHVFGRYAQLLRARSASPAFHPHGGQQVLDCGETVFALLRLSPDGSQCVMCLHNISDQFQNVIVDVKDVFNLSSGRLTDLITDQLMNEARNGNLVLQPYQTLWLRIKE
jgi:glucosylglycerate phosphorylase